MAWRWDLAKGLSALPLKLALVSLLPAFGMVVVVQAVAQPPAAEPEKAKAPSGAADDTKPKLGLHLNDPKAFQGYTLLAPMNSTKTYLIDMQGRVVHTWESDCTPALSAYLLENGHLLRPGALGRGPGGGAGGPPPGGPGQGGPPPGGPGGPQTFMPGAGGRVQEFTWEGELVWDYKLTRDNQSAHHDICRLPNGNVIVIAWDKKTAKEALAAGRRPELVGENSLMPDCLLEVRPTGKTTGEVVWEWHLWDHLVQDLDAAKPCYGKVSEHPELVNVNYGEDVLAPILASKDGQDKLKGIGYVGGGNAPPGRGRMMGGDWTHFNAVAYNPELNQLVVSVHNFSEIWIIDHSTTMAEAASHQGGRSGKGGDLLYRWGNPRAYHAGEKKDQRLFAQHSAHWISRGLNGEGHLLVFNNGNGRPDGTYSTVDEVVLPVDAKGRYERKPDAPFGPDKAVWSYAAAKKSDLYSPLISGAQRLPNGGTLVCSGVNGTIMELSPQQEIVWKYVNPTKGGPGPGGMMPFRLGGGGGPGGPPPVGQIMPSFLQDVLQLTADQKKQMEDFQKETTAQLEKVLTDEQKKQLKEPQGFGAMPQPGQLMAPTVQARLKLGSDQKKEVETLQKKVDETLDKMLTDAQKKQFKEMGQGFARGGPGGFGGPGGPRGPGGGPGGGPMMGFGAPGGGSLFRAYRYAPDFPGLAGRELKPGKTLEELQPKESDAK